MRYGYVTVILIVSLLLLTLLTVLPAHAASTPSLNIQVKQASNGKLSFTPARVACQPQTWVLIKVTNTTKHTIGLLLDGRVLATDNPPILHAGHNTVNAVNTVASPGLHFDVTQANHKAVLFVPVC